MIKELKYLFYLIVVFLFLFFTTKYYFSDENEKKFFTSFQLLNRNLDNYVSNLPLLKSDTENIIEYVESNVNQNKKTYYFWNLLTDNEK